MPKILGLFAAIIVVVVFAFWQYTRLRPSDTTVTNPNSSGIANGSLAPNGTGTPNVMLASASGNREAGPGQVRYFDETLDADPGTIGVTQIQPGRADAFRQFKPPARTFTSPTTSFSPPRNWGGGGLPGGNTGARPYGNQVTLRPTEPPMEVKLDGVVLGSPSEAVLSVVEGSGNGSSGSTKTLYLKAGDRINKRLKIISITEAGIMINGWSEIWLVGQSRSLGGPKPAPMPAAEDTRSSVLPSGLFAVPPPATLTR